VSFQFAEQHLLDLLLQRRRAPKLMVWSSARRATMTIASAG